MERYSSYKRQHASYTVKRLDGADGNILRFHQRYELVPANYLYHLFGRQYTRDVSRNLRKGIYIGFPPVPVEERVWRLPRNSFYWTTLQKRGEQLVGKPRRDNDQLPHKQLRCQVEILLDHGPFVVKRPEDILAHDDCPPETRKADSPFSIPPKPKLRPDITRGFEDDNQTIFVHFEVDRSTERRTKAEDTTSLEDKIVRYVEYLNSKMWRTHFGFLVPPSVVFLTTTKSTDAIRDLIQEHVPEKWHDRFYWLSIPKSPLPTYDLFVPWQGVDGTLNLKELLSERPRESGESGPALKGD